jgi:hypothetical protein
MSALGKAWDLANRGGSGKAGGRGGVIKLAGVIAAAVAGFTRPGTARRVTYVLYDQESPETEGYASKDALDGAVGSTITVMRDAGLIHPDSIVDGRSTTETPETYTGPAEYVQVLIDALKRMYVHDRQEGQQRRIVIWTEAADTIPGLRALADKYGCMLVSSSGTNTDQQRMNLGRIMAKEQRPITVLYVGDYDPPGVFMPSLIATATETWAARWFMYETLVEGDMPLSEQEVYRLACQCFPRRLPDEPWHAPGAAMEDGLRKVLPDEFFSPPWFADVEVIRVAIIDDDLDDPGNTTTKAKADQVRQYARWWRRGETRTLQVEALSIEEIERRVEETILGVLEVEVYNAVVAEENAPREALRAALEAVRNEFPTPG